jgi:uronate dehydrogenase
LSKRDGPVLLTGAGGTIGRLLGRRLAELGWNLRLTDIAPLPYAVPAGASFELMDIENRDAVAALAEGCKLILHFGGVSTEQSFDAILGPNFRGSFNIYEAARANKARVVFPSSVHAVGLSKAYGEMLARLYWDKHEVESVVIRIGSVLPEVTDARILSTWISHDDFVSLIERSADAERVGCTIVWGTSENSASWWRGDGRETLGWTPRDSSDDQADRVRDKVTDDPIVERYQGGKFIVVDYTRDGFVPEGMFGWIPPR